MNESKNYVEINRESWNKKVDFHVASSFYDVAGFKAGKTSLNQIELDLLGDINGKSVLHLQCHFGQDSISLGRMGADVTGVDLSDKAIATAQSLADELNQNTRFICCDIYDLPKHLTQKFDIVFTSYGTIGWLPNLDKWANIIASFLKPGGQFVFAEFHPVVWMFDDNFNTIQYKYSSPEPIVETYQGTYADKNADLEAQYVMWNHGIADVLSSLLKHKIEITAFQEFDYSPYNCFNQTVEFEPGLFRIKHLDDKIPMVYALSGRRKA